MRPLYHPSIDEITVQGILYALSDPIRVKIFAELAKTECAKNCSTFQIDGTKKLAKSSLSQHFKILRESGLIRSNRVGVELKNLTRCADLKDKFGPLIGEIIKAYQNQDKQI